MLVLITDPAKSNLHPSFKGEVLKIIGTRLGFYVGILIDNSLKESWEKNVKWDICFGDFKIIHGFDGDWNLPTDS